jgi:hypothetical protein
MNDGHRTNELDRVGALRAQRRADAVVAQYLHELSHRNGTPVAAAESVTGGEADHDAVALAAKSR